MKFVNALIRRPSNLVVPTSDYPAEVTQGALQPIKSGKNKGRLAFFVTFTADVGEHSPVNGLGDYLLVLPLDTGNPQSDKVSAARLRLGPIAVDFLVDVFDDATVERPVGGRLQRIVLL
jgi:hypothetical protein